jgi:hypothetical protein
MLMILLIFFSKIQDGIFFEYEGEIPLMFTISIWILFVSWIPWFVFLIID